MFVFLVVDTQTRIRTGDAQTTHKMVSGVTLVGGNGSELARLPGGAELNILPANGAYDNTCIPVPLLFTSRRCSLLRAAIERYA